MFFKKKKRNLVDDLELASKWVAKALNSSNYQADYSVESLKEIDRFFKEENKPGGILSKNVGQILFSLGAYVGDVFIKEFLTISQVNIFYSTLLTIVTKLAY